MRKLILTLLAAFAVFAALAGSASASHVLVDKPIAKELVANSSDILDLGVIGPGQKVELVVERGTGEMHPLYGNEKSWDQLNVDKDSLPPGWEGVDALVYENPMKAFIIAARDAPDGEYVFSLTAVDELEGTPPQVIRVKVTISRDVLDFEPVTKSVSAGGGQPAVYTFRLTNKASASDVFEISVSGGLPSRWTFSKQVFVPLNSEAEAQYEVVSEEYGKFPIKFKAVSLSSSEISKETPAELVVQSSLYLEAKATSHGILLFPSVEQAIYSFIGFAANVASYFF